VLVELLEKTMFPPGCGKATLSWSEKPVLCPHCKAPLLSREMTTRPPES
jgi:predicted amidophosphoribosyltransferase